VFLVDCATNNNPALECSRAHNCRVLNMRFWGHKLRFRRLISLISGDVVMLFCPQGKKANLTEFS
jgi:hypothetical protein